MIAIPGSSDVDRRWKSHWPPDVPDLIAQRAANIEERHHPAVFLEGSGTFVADTAGAVTGIESRHDPSDLRCDWLPRLAPKWLAVVDGRGRVPWSFTSNADISLLVLVSARTPWRTLPGSGHSRCPTCSLATIG